MTPSYLSEHDLFGDKELDTSLQVLILATAPTLQSSDISVSNRVHSQCLHHAEILSAVVSRAYSTSREATQVSAEAS